MDSILKLLFLMAFTILACGDAKPTNAEKLSASITPHESIFCFEKYVNKLDELLTEADIRSVYPAAASFAEYDYVRVGAIQFHTCLYQWDSDRTYMMKVGKQEIVVPRPNKIGIGCLSTYKDKIEDPLAYFKNAHRTPTKEELAEYQKMSREKMEEEGLTSSEQQIGKEITSPFLDKISFTSIDGIGDAAAWDHMDSALVILVGRAVFKLYVEVSGDDEGNQQIAQKLAKIVLAKC